MATDFIMPRLADTQPSHYFQHQPQPQPQPQPPQPQSHAYAHAQLPDHAPQQLVQGYQSRQVSPMTTSNNGSPTSPKPYHRQRLRPLYMPAVLRPNEHPYKTCHGNKHEGEPQTPGQDDYRPMSSANSFISLPGLAAWSRLSRRSTGDSGECTDSEWNLDLFPQPTALPTRLHWKVCSKHQRVSHVWFDATRAGHVIGVPIPKPKFATSPPVCATSATGQGGIIAEDVEISFVIYTPPLAYRSIKMQTTILGEQ
ncbi:hypothetical protein E0Z10_g5599 [Xylaria hypoxylon]|uniref:Uncharacterized protein n=1 Tax=Xylaria hypoxylon TaxID=37992 RepID=A0A4Z0YVI7_9PEZI|nr:hypothetical protein E0Z10_g5599 [Xylaria hypoxylon]